MSSPTRTKSELIPSAARKTHHTTDGKESGAAYYPANISVAQTNKQKFKVRQPQRAAKSKRPNAPADGSKNNGIHTTKQEEYPSRHPTTDTANSSTSKQSTSRRLMGVSKGYPNVGRSVPCAVTNSLFDPLEFTTAGHGQHMHTNNIITHSKICFINQVVMSYLHSPRNGPTGKVPDHPAHLRQHTNQASPTCWLIALDCAVPAKNNQPKKRSTTSSRNGIHAQRPAKRCKLLWRNPHLLRPLLLHDEHFSAVAANRIIQRGHILGTCPELAHPPGTS